MKYRCVYLKYYKHKKDSHGLDHGFDIEKRREKSFLKLSPFKCRKASQFYEGSLRLVQLTSKNHSTNINSQLLLLATKPSM